MICWTERSCRVVGVCADPIHVAQGMWAVDALGRRNTTIYGSCGMAVSQLIVAITGAAISVNNQAGQKVLVAFTCIFIGEKSPIPCHSFRARMPKLIVFVL